MRVRIFTLDLLRENSFLCQSSHSSFVKLTYCSLFKIGRVLTYFICKIKKQDPGVYLAFTQVLRKCLLTSWI